MEHKKTTSHEVQLEKNDVAYIRFPESEKDQKVAQSVSLRDILSNYQGYDVVFDFSEEGILIGIEILVF